MIRLKPWIFETWPGLESLPWLPLVDAPTPVARLENLGQRLGREIWVKRDDLTATEYGGNKPRKLEFILAAALASGKKEIITGGGLGTNHGLATALYGQKAGLKVILGLFHQPVTDSVRRNLKLHHACGAEMIYTGSLWRAALRYYVTERVFRRQAYFVDPGGSCPIGTLGYVDAGLELARQVEQGLLPEPAQVFVAAGTCGTLAGLTLGFKLAGLKTKPVGVRVAPGPFSSRSAALKLARKTLELMRARDPDVPPLKLSENDLLFETSALGPGYGHPTPDGEQAITLAAAEEGLTLDSTYTGKTLGALIKNAPQPGPTLFWNTYNSADLSPKAASVDWQNMPPCFHRFFRS